MKKFFLAFALSAACFSGATYAQSDTEKQPASFILDESGNLTETTAPVIEFETETHDFGTVDEGPKIEYEFHFKNTGKEPLVLSNVKPSCGCTTPEWSKEPIAPGASSVIKAIYNTQGRPGPFNKSITITSNAYTPTKRIFIKGEVTKADTPATTPVKEKPMMSEGTNE